MIAKYSLLNQVSLNNWEILFDIVHIALICTGMGTNWSSSQSLHLCIMQSMHTSAAQSLWKVCVIMINSLIVGAD